MPAMEMRTESPIKTRREGAVLEVTLDAPKANAISLKTSRVMGLVFRDFRDDDSLRVCIIRAAGEKFFCPGWDLKAAADGDAVDGDYGVGGFAGLQELPNLNKPVIAAVQGICCGGCAPPTRPLRCRKSGRAPWRMLLRSNCPNASPITSRWTFC
jgi:crotonobetainyl-CoA hydratase